MSEQTDNRPLAGQLGLVTGASRGIGEATALALAEAGMHVVLTARDDRALEAVEEKIHAAGGSAKQGVWAAHGFASFQEASRAVTTLPGLALLCVIAHRSPQSLPVLSIFPVGNKTYHFNAIARFRRPLSNFSSGAHSLSIKTAMRLLDA